MTLNKKEKTMLLVLGIVVYLFAFIKIVIVDAMPKIKETQQKLLEVQRQEAVLEAEYLNLQAYKDDIRSKQVVDERLGSYLMNNAGLAEGILFIEKLAILFDTELGSIKLGVPQALSVKEAKYFGFPIEFTASLTYDAFHEIIAFCEGGSRKVNISSFDFKQSIKKDLYDISIKMVFYSIDRESADKLFQYCRLNFQKFRDRAGDPVYITIDEEPDFSEVTVVQGKGGDITKSNADFIVVNQGYLYGGYNFETFSSLNSDKRIRKTTTEKMDVLLTFTDTDYTIETTDFEGVKDVVNGSIPDRDFTFFIESNVITEVEENKNIYLNITVQNDSKNDIRVKMLQTGNRVKLMDRAGNVINGKSDEEKVYIG